MKKTFTIFAVLAFVLLVLGFAIQSEGMAPPLLRAMGSVFFILAFITKIAEAVESEG